MATTLVPIWKSIKGHFEADGFSVLNTGESDGIVRVTSTKYELDLQYGKFRMEGIMEETQEKYVFKVQNIDPKTNDKLDWCKNKFITYNELKTDPVLFKEIKDFIQFIKDKLNNISTSKKSKKDARPPFDFISSSSEKTTEEVLRQQGHSLNDASIEIQPVKPHPPEQQQLQMQQRDQYREYLLRRDRHNILISSNSGPTMVHPSMMTIHHNQNSCYTPTSNNNNGLEQIDQRGQGDNIMEDLIGVQRMVINNNDSLRRWSTGNNDGLSSMSGNRGVYGTSGNPVSPSSLPSVYQRNQGQSMYNPNGFNQQAAYPHSNYPNRLQPSYGLLSSKPNENVYENQNLPLLLTISRNDTQPSYGLSLSQPNENVYENQNLPLSITIPRNDNPSSSSPGNQYAPANPANDPNQANYDPNMYYVRYNPNLLTPQYYPQQQPTASAANRSQTQIPIDQTISPNGFTQGGKNCILPFGMDGNGREWMGIDENGWEWPNEIFPP